MVIDIVLGDTLSFKGEKEKTQLKKRIDDSQKGIH